MKRIVFEGIPKCSTPEQFRYWVAAARHVPPGRAGFCEDCTQEYATEMRLCELCEHPEIIFDENGDGCLPTEHKIRSIARKTGKEII